MRFSVKRIVLKFIYIIFNLTQKSSFGLFLKYQLWSEFVFQNISKSHVSSITTSYGYLVPQDAVSRSFLAASSQFSGQNEDMA